MNEKLPRTPLSTPLSGSAREAELRLRNIFSGPKKRPPALFLAAVFAVCLLCGNLVSCQVKEVEGPEAEAWVDYSDTEERPWSQSAEIQLEEYPGVTFHWTPGGVTAADETGETVLIGGMPVWNVFLCDLNGDGRREFCATVSFGSGVIDDHIEVYDYAAGQLYLLWDREEYDYALSLEDGQLRVSQWEYTSGPPSQSEPLSTGGLALSAQDGREGEWFIAQPAAFLQQDEPFPLEQDSMPFDQPVELYFLSGAGGWSTDLRVLPDGSFEGYYHDSDMGDGGENYPHGTEYVCPFHGSFRDIVPLTDTSWSLTLEELVLDTKYPVGTEWDEDIFHNISSQPAGFTDGDGNALKPGAQFILYSPEARGDKPGTELYGARDLWDWCLSRPDLAGGDPLGCWDLYNVEEKIGFFS